MKILLVTTTDKLAEKLAVLNPELEYCAIVVDEVEPAKEILPNVGLSQDLIYPMEELKNCVENLQYDYVLCLQDRFYNEQILKLKMPSLPKEKIVSFATLPTTKNFMTKRRLKYYQAHSQEIEMFATGTSTTEAAIDIRNFKYKAINFAESSQDLYYNFLIAKDIISYGGEHNKLRYALIGLAPYSFHFDLSKTFMFKCRVLLYFIAFNDLHNFPVPLDIYKKFFRENWSNRKLSIAKVNINGVKSHRVIAKQDIVKVHPKTWAKKSYPETRDENIKILDDYLTLCEENNVRPIMFRVIVSEKYMKNFNPNLLEEFNCIVEQACEKHPSACFVDGWKLQGFTYDDFYDHGHMNIHGAAKFSAYLSGFIEGLETKEH